MRNGRWIVRIIERGEAYEEDFGIEEGARLGIRTNIAPQDEGGAGGRGGLSRFGGPFQAKRRNQTG